MSASTCCENDRITYASSMIRSQGRQKRQLIHRGMLAPASKVDYKITIGLSESQTLCLLLRLLQTPQEWANQWVKHRNEVPF
jgi:hypothetical protein